MPSRPPPPPPYETWLDWLLRPDYYPGVPLLKWHLETAAAELAELRREYASSHAIVVRQGELLTGVANALRGEPEPLHLHSHYDLPELAAAVVAERNHWKANHDEMVARNAILRDRQADNETLKLQNAVLRAEIERLKAEPRTCLVCGVIMHEPTPDPADEYLRTAKAAVDAAKETTC